MIDKFFSSGIIKFFRALFVLRIRPDSSEECISLNTLIFFPFNVIIWSFMSEIKGCITTTIDLVFFEFTTSTISLPFVSSDFSSLRRISWMSKANGSNWYTTDLPDPVGCYIIVSLPYNNPESASSWYSLKFSRPKTFFECSAADFCKDMLFTTMFFIASAIFCSENLGRVLPPPPPSVWWPRLQKENSFVLSPFGLDKKEHQKLWRRTENGPLL